MDNISLNPGGLVGALGFAAAAAGISTALDVDSDSVIKLSFAALVAGALVGNAGWSRLFPTSADKEQRQGAEQDDGLGSESR